MDMSDQAGPLQILQIPLKLILSPSLSVLPLFPLLSPSFPPSLFSSPFSALFMCIPVLIIYRLSI